MRSMFGIQIPHAIGETMTSHAKHYISYDIRFHLNYKTPPGVIKYRERHTPESTPAFFEVTSPKGAMLLLCLSVLDHSVEVFTNFAGHTFACSILQLKL